jgi:hypothetical protein
VKTETAAEDDPTPQAAPEAASQDNGATTEKDGEGEREPEKKRATG